MVAPEVGAHTPAFAKAAGGPPGKKTLILGAKALAMTGLDILLDKKARERVEAEFQASKTRARGTHPKRSRKKRP
jgi:hypothetical protein